MKTSPQKLTYTQIIPAARDRVFSFFTDEKNLEILTPAWLSFSVIGKSTEKLGEGTRIDYRLKIRRVPIRWQSLIIEWKPNESFVDMMTKGPYKSWHHTHSFVDVPGGTQMTDTILYQIPGGRTGRLVLGPWIRSDIDMIFRFRQEKISKIFGA